MNKLASCVLYAARGVAYLGSAKGKKCPIRKVERLSVNLLAAKSLVN